MAQSGVIPISVTGTNSISGQIVWSETATNTNNNTSTVTAKLVYTCNGGATTGGGRSSFTITINGVTSTYTGEFSISPGTSKEVFGGTYGSVVSQLITHNNDGTKSITISGGGYVEYYDTTSKTWKKTAGLSASSGSGTVALTTLARQSKWASNSAITVASAAAFNVDLNVNVYAN